MKRVLMALEILNKKVHYDNYHSISIVDSDGRGRVQYYESQTNLDSDLFEFDNLDELRDWAEGVILQDSTPLKLSRKGKKELDKEVEE